mgnify:CR=1 FL=1
MAERIDTINEKLSLRERTDGLTFGTDAFLLAAFIRPAPRARAVELGAGTGVISLLCASKRKFAHVTAVEIQKEFVEIAARNVVENGLSDVVDVREGDVRELRVNDIGGEVNTVFANPPYMRADTGAANQSDAKNAARHEVFGGIDDFCACAARLLKTGGHFVSVWRPDRLCDLLAAMKTARLEPKRMTFVHADAETEPSMVLVDAVRGGAAGLRVTPPLLLHDCPCDVRGARRLSDAATRVYDECRLSY